MTDHASHQTDESPDPHGPTDHGASDHGDDAHDDHHAGEPLGPVDVAGWGMGIVGVVLGLVVAGAFALSTGALG